MKGLVSVIIPIFNREKYIKKCVESVISQTYEKLEVILIDDGSTDKSYEICKNLTIQDSRVKVYQFENSGVSNARNKGVELSNGEYIIFIDSDDYIEPEMISRMVDEIIKNEADVCLCGYNLIGKENCKIYLKEGVYSFYEFSDLMSYWKTNPIIGSPWNKVYRANIIKNNDIKFIYKLHFAEDYLFNLIYYRYCDKICVLSDCLYNYNRTTNNSLSNNNDKEILLKINTIEVIEKYMSVLYAEHFTEYNYFDSYNEISSYFIILSFRLRVKEYGLIKSFMWFYSLPREVRKCLNKTKILQNGRKLNIIFIFLKYTNSIYFKK